MQFDGVAAWGIGAHRLFSVGGEEKVSMVGAHHRLLDARRCQLSNRSCEVVDDVVHDLSSMKCEAGLSDMINFLQRTIEILYALDSLCKLRGLKAKKVIEGNVNELGHPRGSKLLPRREIGEERVLDLRTQL